jgi:hypothetical protein
LFVPAITFGLETIKEGMTLDAFHADFWIIEKCTGELFGGRRLGLDFEIPEKADQLIGIEAEDKFFQVFFEQFVDSRLRVRSLGCRVDKHFVFIF